MPGEKVTVLKRFDDYEGLYLYHCHNLECEDLDMMRTSGNKIKLLDTSTLIRMNPMGRFITATLVIFLASLQLIAPLVHAHLGDDISPPGLHVPGLEGYQPSDGISVSPSNDSRVEAGLIVAVETGVLSKLCKQKAQTPLFLASNPRLALAPRQAPPVFPPSEVFIFDQFRFLPLSPRAPPHLIS